jgi:RNA polymerase sigma-70 factor (ECF subfamily)
VPQRQETVTDGGRAGVDGIQPVRGLECLRAAEAPLKVCLKHSSMTITPISLLERLKRPVDQKAWSRFVDLYSPLIYAWARQVGLQETDAADLVQDVFGLLVVKMPEFAHDRQGCFRAWLKTVTLNKWRENGRRASARREGEPLPEVVASEDSEVFWEVEYRQHIVGQALKVMQTDFAPKTWKACLAVVVEDRPAAQVADELGISIGTVYAAKCRVLARLRQELAGLLN